MRGISLVREPEVMDAGFGRDVFALHRPRCEQLQFAGGADVQHMQPCAVFLGQRNRVAAAAVTGLFVPDDRVLLQGDRFTPLRHRKLHVGAHGRLVFGMHRQQHVCSAEQRIECFRSIHEHVARARTEEGLQPADRGGIRAQHFVQVVVGDTHVERVVHHRRGRTERILRFEQFLRERLRNGVRHLHETGDATGGGTRTAMEDILLVGQSRLPEVHLIIDGTGKQIAPFAVDVLRGCDGTEAFFGYTFDGSSINEQVGLHGATIVHDVHVA